ncbi:putative SOS response-associated peptidase YedK [Pontibacter mucosus]|uniref:Abasic site processing protein n=1 Tax=Pontibacter mucosus TaxID=1649266 RepID=A0A2T5YE87_9BACT|nr:SOS response-associated peptidase [Pontibacter mucosus]PTX15026.1 putative SOS response-associated peptidase YedK [Pontibacter mucosus]
MCGRYSIITKKKESKGSVRAAKLLEKAQADNRFNAAPSQLLPVITNQDPEHVQFFSWGLVPHWAKEKAYKHKSINARAETITEKPTFRQLVNQKRCLVPADSFYEWRTTPTGKQPYRILLKDEGIFCFAGLWDEWADPDTGEVFDTFTIITTEANELMRPLHDRMPVLLHPEEEAEWLSGEQANEHLLSLLKPYPSEEMKAYPVSTLVNSPANDSPEVLEPMAEQGDLFS